MGFTWFIRFVLAPCDQPALQGSLGVHELLSLDEIVDSAAEEPKDKLVFVNGGFRFFLCFVICKFLTILQFSSRCYSVGLTLKCDYIQMTCLCPVDLYFQFNLLIFLLLLLLTIQSAL